MKERKTVSSVSEDRVLNEFLELTAIDSVSPYGHGATGHREEGDCKGGWAD